MQLNIEHLWLVLGTALVAYLVGSLNLSIVSYRLLGKGDLRSSGSNNAGATNLLRLAGWKIAVPVLLADFGKAFGIIWGARLLGLQDLSPAFVLPLLLGNRFPVFHGFRGGKGVAVLVGAMLAIDYIVMLMGGLVFLITLALGRRVSLGSILMACSYPLFMWLQGGHTKIALISIATCVLVILVTHRANIGRLIRGEERKLGTKPQADQ
jgi:acyl phosphate:glycerol-3-phosphate acyltransferase